MRKRPEIDFRRAECVICGEPLSEDGVWRQAQSSRCPCCKKLYDCLKQKGTQHKLGARRMRSLGDSFETPEEQKRARAILSKPYSRLSNTERDWCGKLMRTLGHSTRGRKQEAGYARVIKVMARLEFAQAPLPSYQAIAECLGYVSNAMSEEDRIKQELKGENPGVPRQRIRQALLAERSKVKLPSPPIKPARN